MTDNAAPQIGSQKLSGEPMTDHPAIAAGCTKAQIAAFERIAIGDTGGHHPQVLGALYAKKLIDFTERQSSDGVGNFRWREPFVPPSIHYQWCCWCDENVDDEAAE